MILNPNTKKAKGYIRWFDSLQDSKTIYTAYRKPSQEKIRHWERIKAKCEKAGGYNLTVLGHNSSYFSTAFCLQVRYGDDIVIWLVINTYANVYYIPYKKIVGNVIYYNFD